MTCILLMCSGLCVLLLFVIILYHKFIRCAYWHERGVRGPKTKFFYGNLEGNTTGDVDHDIGKLFGQMPTMSREYGDVYGLQLGMRAVLVTSNVQILKQVFKDKNKQGKFIKHVYDTDVTIFQDPRNLIYANGVELKKMRETADSLSKSKVVNQFLPIFWDSSARMCKKLAAALQQGDTDTDIDLAMHFESLNWMIISRVAAGQNGVLSPTFDFDGWDELAHLTEKLYDERLRIQFKGHSKVWVNRLTYYAWCLPWLAPMLAPLLCWQWRSEVTEFNGIGRQLGHFQSTWDKIDPRIRQKILDANQTDASRLDAIFQDDLIPMNGFEASSKTLVWIVYHLCENQPVLHKLQDEITSIRFQGTEKPCLDQLNKMKYANAIINETLRLHPMFPNAANRICFAPTMLEMGSGPQLLVEPGTQIMPDMVTLHHDKTIWGENADEFDPNRWLVLTAEESVRLQNAFFSFGKGTRMCPGKKLAFLKIKVVLVDVLRAFKLNEAKLQQK